MERATFPPSRPSLNLAAGRKFVADRAPQLRSNFASAILLGLRFVQARLISVWGLVVAAMFCPPYVFAVFAVFSAVATFVSIAALMRLEAVFFRSSDRARLGLAFRLAMAVGATFLIFVIAVLAVLIATGWVAPAVAFFFLISLSARSLLRLLWAEATAEGDFRAIGNSNVVQALVQPAVMLLLIAIFGPKALALFMADAVGHVLAAAYLVRRRRTALLPLVQPALWSLHSLREAAHRWRDAPRILLPSALLSFGFTVAPLLALPYAANPLLAAHVALAMRLLDMPTQMFGTVSGPIVLNRLRIQAGPRRRFWLRVVTVGLMAAAAALFAGIGFGAVLADDLLDGTKWAGVGDVVAVMTLFYIGIAPVGTLHDIAALARHPSWQITTNAVALLAIIAAMLWFGALSPALLYVVGGISVARMLAHVWFTWTHCEQAPEAAEPDLRGHSLAR
ncbi:hypothetical protein ASE63_10780 [Bosea sp. Root381]|nr:hypothetical protein ASE63_10780 [Bosea sp. Root381]